MTREQKRIKIAQAYGWKFCPPSYHKPPYSDAFKSEALLCWVRPGNDDWQQEAPPDYFGSLDAMHEAEERLTDLQFESFQIELTRIVFNHACAVTYPVGFKCRAFWRATAEQRAEAFGLALGLWKEGE